jgi:hypothetical protein
MAMCVLPGAGRSKTYCRLSGDRGADFLSVPSSHGLSVSIESRNRHQGYHESFITTAGIRLRARPYPPSIADTSGFSQKAQTPAPKTSSTAAMMNGACHEP